MENERTTLRTKMTRTTLERDSDKQHSHLRRSWRSVVRVELAKLLKGETELRDLIYFSDKFAG